MHKLEKIIVITHFDSNQEDCFENNVSVPCPDSIEEYKINLFATDLQKITNQQVQVLASEPVAFQENVFYVIFTHSLYYFTQFLDTFNAKDRLNLTQRMFLFPATGKKPRSFGNDLFAGNLHLSYYQLCSKYTQVMPFTERNNHFFFWGIPEAMKNMKERYKVQDVEIIENENNYALWQLKDDLVFEIGLYIKGYIEMFDEIKSLDHWTRNIKTKQ